MRTYLILTLVVLVHVGAGCATTLSTSAYTTVSTPLNTQPTDVRDDDPDQTRAKRLFVRGLTHQVLGENRKALTFFEEALTLTPDQPAILAAMAEVHLALDQPSSATFYAVQAHEHEPENAVFHNLVAEVYLGIGDFESALSTYETILEQHPDDFEARFALSQLLAAQNRPGDALENYQELIRLRGEDLQVRYEMLRLLRSLDRPELMQATLEALILLDPSNLSLQRLLGDLYVENNRTMEAIALYEQLVAQMPDDPQTLAVLSDLYHQTGDQDKVEALLQPPSTDFDGLTPRERLRRAALLAEHAVADPAALESARQLYASVLSDDPLNDEALCQAGLLEYRMQAYEEATALLSKCVAHTPRELDAWIRLGNAYLIQGLPGLAASTAEEASLLFPGQLPLLRVSTLASTATEDNDRAAEYALEALTLYEEDGVDDSEQQAEFLASLGLAYARQQEPGRADSALTLALSLSEDHPYVLYTFATHLGLQGTRLDQALSMAERAVEADPDHPVYLGTLGWLYGLTNQHDAAHVRLQQAVETGRADATIFERLGDVQLQMGNRSQALSSWQRALELDPDRTSLRQKIQPSQQ